MSEWITTHSEGKEQIILKSAITSLLEMRDGRTMLFLSSGLVLYADEDIATVKGEMFL